jgi:hypothetical protein
MCYSLNPNELGTRLPLKLDLYYTVVAMWLGRKQRARDQSEYNSSVSFAAVTELHFLPPPLPIGSFSIHSFVLVVRVRGWRVSIVCS